MSETDEPGADSASDPDSATETNAERIDESRESATGSPIDADASTGTDERTADVAPIEPVADASSIEPNATLAPIRDDAVASDSPRPANPTGALRDEPTIEESNPKGSESAPEVLKPIAVEAENSSPGNGSGNGSGNERRVIPNATLETNAPSTTGRGAVESGPTGSEASDRPEIDTRTGRTPSLPSGSEEDAPMAGVEETPVDAVESTGAHGGSTSPNEVGRSTRTTGSVVGTSSDPTIPVTTPFVRSDLRAEPKVAMRQRPDPEANASEPVIAPTNDDAPSTELAMEFDTEDGDSATGNPQGPTLPFRDSMNTASRGRSTPMADAELGPFSVRGSIDPSTSPTLGVDGSNPKALAEAARSLATAAAPASVPVQQILAQVQRAVRPGMQELRIRLDPPALGSLTLKFALEGDSLAVIVRASRPEVVEALKNDLSGFADTLAKSGIDLASLEVSLDSGSDADSRSFRESLEDAVASESALARARTNPRATEKVERSSATSALLDVMA